MKLSIKFFLTITVLAITYSTYAIELNPEYSVKNVGAKSFYLKLMHSQAKTVQIRIQDENKYVLFSEEVNDPSKFYKKINLNKLPQGAYFLILEDEKKLQIQPITINQAELIIDTAQQKIIYKPAILLKNDRLDLTLMSKEDKELKIQIIDEANDVLYKEELSQFGNFRKRFDVSNLKKGNYTLSVKVNGLTFDKAFTISKNTEKVTDTKTFFFNGNSISSNNCEIKLKDKNGLTLFSEYVIEPGTFVRNYNLSELPNGTYYLYAEGDLETQKFVIEVEPTGIKTRLNNNELVQ